MKRIILLLLAFSALPAFGTTWYVNSSGGNRYEATDQPTGQCDGQSSAAYPGTGTNQHCAFNDIRYLWTDGTYTTDVNAGAPKWGWIIAGGDTAIIDCTGMTGNSCRVGQNGPNSGDSFGLNGNPFSAGAPSIPAGTAGAHTRILGKNYASCSSPSAETQINGGYGVSWVFSLGNTNYVDLQCFNITDSSTCNQASSFTTSPCSTSYPLSDYAKQGVIFYENATNIHVQDLYVHGTSHDCFGGPTGDVTTISNVILSGCPDSNWNMDPGDGTTGTGSLTLTNVYNVFSGFEEVWPINHANDLVFSWGTVGQVGDGTDQNIGGYGDAFGTTTVQSNPAWIININGGGAAYATQDGYDFLHTTGNGSRININHVFSYGNMGQQVKLGAAGSLVNAELDGNCNANRTLPGLAPAAVAQLSLYCRAGDAAVFIAINNSESTNVYYNTLITASVIAYEVATEAVCNNSTCVLNFKNNIMSGFANSTTNGYSSAQATNKLPNPMYFDNDNPYLLGGSTYDHNATFNQWTTAPCMNSLYNETNGLCTSPQLADMTWHLSDMPNMAPASGSSAVVGAGVAISGITTDYSGGTRPTPSSIGAREFTAGPPPPTLTSIAVTPNPGAVNVSSTLSMVCTATFSDSSTAACSSPVWTDTAAHSSVNSSKIGRAHV